MTDFKSKVDDLRKQRLAEEKRRAAQQEAEQLKRDRQVMSAIRQREEGNNVLIARIRASAAYRQARTELNSKTVQDALKYMHALLKPTVTNREVRKGLLSWFWGDDGEKVYVTRPVPLSITVAESVTYKKLHNHEKIQHEAIGMPKPATGISVKIIMPIGDSYLIGKRENLEVTHRENIIINYHIDADLKIMIMVNGLERRIDTDWEGTTTWYQDIFLPFESIDDVLDYFAVTLSGGF